MVPYCELGKENNAFRKVSLCKTASVFKKNKTNKFENQCEIRVYEDTSFFALKTKLPKIVKPSIF